jgi:molybdopterin-guanine dinucleotide biosynthesis protein B
VALVKPVIFQVVGYQNSGKTSVITKLIHALKENGINTVTIKHHGHGGKPEVTAEKDSSKHLTAGAIASIVEGDGRLVLQADHFVDNLEDQIKLMDFFQPDVILIEGHKEKNYPKLLLIKGKKDLQLLKVATNVKMIMYWDDAGRDYLQQKTDIPSFNISNDEAINWLVQTLSKFSS